MKERPIIFSTDMVRAILDGRKTQTRRVMKLQPRKWLTNDPEHPGWSWGGGTKKSDLLGTDIDGIKAWCPLFCPYGQVGDKLWVRETWKTVIEFEDRKPSELKTDAPIGFMDGKIRFVYDTHPTFGRLRPSIFMPRWASRITLEITEIRVERLQDISADDVKAEGASWDFYLLWDSINGKKYPWSSNPWVWVIHFRQLN